MTARTNLDDDEGEHAKDDTLGDATRKGHGDHRDKARQGIGQIGEVDLHDGLHHHHTHENQCGGSGCRRDAEEKGREEEGGEEKQSHRQGGEASTTTSSHARSALYKGSDGGGTTECTCSSTDSIGQQGTVHAIELSRLRIHHPSTGTGANEGAQRVEEVHEK